MKYACVTGALIAVLMMCTAPLAQQRSVIVSCESSPMLCGCDALDWNCGSGKARLKRVGKGRVRVDAPGPGDKSMRRTISCGSLSSELCNLLGCENCPSQ